VMRNCFFMETGNAGARSWVCGSSSKFMDSPFGTHFQNSRAENATQRNVVPNCERIRSPAMGEICMSRGPGEPSIGKRIGLAANGKFP